MSPKVALLIIVYYLVGCLGSNKFYFRNTYGDYMVLQQGNGDENIHSTINGISLYPSDKITLNLSTFANQDIIFQSKSCDVNANNTWQILLDPVNASNEEYYIVATSSINISETITLSHILFGDVYACSGQSNMEFTVDQAFNQTQSLSQANNYPNVRLFTVAETKANSEQTTVTIQEKWSIANNKTVGGGNWTYFSAVCWFFGMHLYDKLNYPLGLIGSDYGGTEIAMWMSKDAISKCPNETNQSSRWNAMIYPFLTMTIKGAIWYQGESDTANEENARSYFCALQSMISDWRFKWNMYSNTSLTFPFGVVQLSSWGGNETCADNEWSQCLGVAIVRWAQTANFGYVPNKYLKNVYMAIATDLGDPSSPYSAVHTRYKQQVGQRLSNAALNFVYGYDDIYWLGPYVNNISCTTNAYGSSNSTTITMNFDNVNSDGLLLKNPTGFEYYNSNLKQWIYIKKDIFNIVNKKMDGIQFRLNDTDISQLRYDYYQAPCLPLQGIYNCAIYDKQQLLPAGPFIFPVTCQ